MSDEKKSEHKYPFEDPEFAAAAGRKGAKATNRKWKRKGIALDKLGDLDTADDVKRWLQVIARGVLAGDLDNKDADIAGRLLKIWLDAHGSSMAQKDLEELREALAEVKRQMSGPMLA